VNIIGVKMLLYKSNNLVVETIKREDIDEVLKLFNSSSFNCDFESGALRPTDWQFKQIMEDIINGDRLNQLLVLKKDDSVIGYLSCYVKYDVLNLGHVVVLEKERNQVYGKLLTEIAIGLASNDNRRVSLTCFYKNVRFLQELGFQKIGCSYIFKENIKNPSLPNLFMSNEEYKIMEDEKIERDRERWNDFLNSGIVDILREIDEKTK